MSESSPVDEPATVSAILLAAGTSSRWGSTTPKQLLRFAGQPLVRRVARVVLSSKAVETIAVVGHAEHRVRAALADLDLVVAANPGYREGQSTSVRAGIRRVSPRSSAAIITLCDQPLLDASLINALIDTFVATGAPAVVPVHNGQRGAPALVARSLFPALEALSGDFGARYLLANLGDAVATVAIDSRLPLLDIDSVDDLAAIKALLGEE